MMFPPGNVGPYSTRIKKYLPALQLLLTLDFTKTLDGVSNIPLDSLYDF